MLNNQIPQISSEELLLVVQYFEKLGYKPDQETQEKIIELSKDFPDKDLVQCAKEMYEWFSEAKKRGRKIKSYHSTFRNWVKKDYAPKKQIKPQRDPFFEREDLL